ncbi:antitoxin [Actinokineospora guangxiensis]|uniref:Antitoxin n=1 Tax=Actinokineospora guangxiensis TaxID=1490288 RepID=A0ABW0ESP8_9PSEU
MPLLKRLTALAGAAAAARNYARKNPQKVERWAAKAGAFVDRKTQGKYHAKIGTAVRRVQDTAHGRPRSR